MSKPTREELEAWGSPTWDGDSRARAARYALDLEREVERLTNALWRRMTRDECDPPAPSPPLDDAFWRRVFAAALLTHEHVVPRSAIEDADALLAALREREGKP